MTGIPPKKPSLHILEMPQDLQYRIISKLPFKSKLNAGLVCKHWDLLLRAGTPTERHWVVELNVNALVSRFPLFSREKRKLTRIILRWLAARAAAIETVHLSANMHYPETRCDEVREVLASLLSLAAGCLSNFENRLNLTIRGESPFSSPLPSTSAFLTAMCPMVKSLNLSRLGVPISHAHIAAICELSNLEELLLDAGWEQSQEGLQDVTSDLSKLVNLKILKLQDHHTLEKIPDSIGCLLKLERMEIVGTKGGWPVARRLPDLNLDSLSSVTLKDCRLGCAPGRLTALSALTFLDLSQNDFQHAIGGRWWPTTLSGLTHLGELIIAACHIASLPNHLSALVQLKKLDVSGNLLRSLPDELSSLQNLTELLLFKNLLPTVPVSILSALTALQTIDLSLQAFPWEPGSAMFSIVSPLLPLLHPGLVKLDLNQVNTLEPLSLFHIGRAVCELDRSGRPIDTLLY